MNRALIILLITFHTQILFGQSPNAPELPSPQPAVFPDYSHMFEPNPSSTVPNVSDPFGFEQRQRNKVEQQNARLMQEYHEHERRRRQQQLEMLNHSRPAVRYEFPSWRSSENAEKYYAVFDQIGEMVEGEKPLNLKEAIFITEDAYNNGRIPKDWFDKHIAQGVSLIKDALRAEGYSLDDDMAKKMMLHRFMSDTIILYDKDDNICDYSLPKTYDFHDIFGAEDWTKMFVSKLLVSNTGQCHSLPLLYLILAEELGIEAHLAISPQHSYVMVQDDQKNWFNLELTNGKYSSDAWVTGSGYVKAEALANGIYMRPLSKRETIANCFNDLAGGYIHKFGFDDFMLKCADKVLQHDEKNVSAWMLKANYYTILFQYIADQKGKPPLDQLLRDPKAAEVFKKRNEVYQTIDNLGHEVMPPEVYKDWLKSLDKNKSLQVKFPRA